jgi:general secretion pathway protein L
MIAGSWARRLASARLVRFRLPTAQGFKPGLEAFVRWWGAELWACLPSRWQNRLRHRPLHFLATVHDDPKRVVIVERNNARPNYAFALPPRNEQEEASLAEVQRALRKEGARLAFLVPEESIARRSMTLPLAAKDKLRETLKAELDRVTGVGDDDVYFDHSIVETDNDARTITISAAIVQRALVERIGAALRAAGLTPSAAHAWRMGARSPDATFFRVNIERTPRADRAITVALVLLVLCLDIAAAYVPLWVKIDALSDLQTRIEMIRPDVEDALRQERILSELRSSDAYLVALKNQAPSMSEVLGELARVLPDSAWLEQLQVREGRLQLEGFVGASADLVSALEQSPMLSDVRFEWPVAADRAANADRFDVSARIARPEKARR